jgi:histone H3/H4
MARKKTTAKPMAKSAGASASVVAKAKAVKSKGKAKAKAKASGGGGGGGVRKTRHRPGYRVEREIRDQQRSTDNCIKKTPFRRLMDEYARTYAKDGIRFASGAQDALQQATEDLTIENFQAAFVVTQHANKKPSMTLLRRHWRTANNVALRFNRAMAVDHSANPRYLPPVVYPKPKRRRSQKPNSEPGAKTKKPSSKIEKKRKEKRPVGKTKTKKTAVATSTEEPSEQSDASDSRTDPALLSDEIVS